MGVVPIVNENDTVSVSVSVVLLSRLSFSSDCYSYHLPLRLVSAECELVGRVAPVLSHVIVLLLSLLISSFPLDV